MGRLKDMYLKKGNGVSFDEFVEELKSMGLLYDLLDVIPGVDEPEFIQKMIDMENPDNPNQEKPAFDYDAILADILGSGL